MNRTLIKSAADLQPHQASALDKLEKEKGIVLHHGTGSGKTLSFLSAIEREHAKSPGAKAFIVAPASLVENIDREIKKHGLKVDPKRLDAYSYEMAANRSEELSKNKYAIAVADEAHRLRDVNTKRSKALTEILSKADKRILATATGTYNHIADISPLVNIAAGKTDGDEVLPTDRKAMENKYVKKVVEKPGWIGKLMGKPTKETIVLNNAKDLKGKLNKYVHYYDAKDDPKMKNKFPERTEEVVEVPMSQDQAKYYKYAEGNIPFMLKMKIRNDMPLDKKDKALLNSFSVQVRQASNSYRHLTAKDADFTPKIKEAVKRLEERKGKDKDFRGVVYSNYLGSGVEEYSKLLTEKKVPHQVFTGSLTKQEKDEMVKNYNSGKSPVLVISSSGAEGLDLKGTSLTQILEPHFNRSKIVQVMGRGARFGSHEHLPKEKRVMHTEHYLSVHPKPLIGKAPTSIDKYLYSNSDDKDVLFDQVKDLMRKK